MTARLVVVCGAVALGCAIVLLRLFPAAGWLFAGPADGRAGIRPSALTCGASLAWQAAPKASESIVPPVTLLKRRRVTRTYFAPCSVFSFFTRELLTSVDLAGMIHLSGKARPALVACNLLPL